MAIRASLLARTALGGVALLAGPSLALPGDPVGITVNAGGSAPGFTRPNDTTLDIDFNAARTVLQYQGFDVAQGETVNLRFDARTDIGIIHNVGEGSISIDGALKSFVGTQFGGNVWLLSASGVFFGANAQVDVGGLLASTSVPSNLTDINGPFLTPTNFAFDFGDGFGQINVAGGANITGHGGTLAFLAPSVTTETGAVIGGAGNTAVLYGAAQRYTVRFARDADNDLDLLDFEVPGLTAGSFANAPLAIAGSTNAGNVYLASVSRADAVRAVLAVTGEIGATSAGIEGGSIVLTSGGGIANRAAASLFTDGRERQDIGAYGAMTANRDISATATGDVIVDTATAGGSIRLRGVDVRATSLTAGQDIVLRSGDAIGSTGTGDGYGYGYGRYGPEGGTIDVRSALAGDDILAVAWNGDVDFDSITLAGMGPDAAGDPLGLDTASDGRRLLLRTTGNYGDVRLGDFRETGEGRLSGGTELVLDAVDAVRVRLRGDAVLTTITAQGGFAELDTTGSLTVGSVAAHGLVRAVAGTQVTIGSATTTIDDFGNGQIALRGGTGATLTTADAATDVVVIADNGDATVGTARAGDDVIVRATGGTARLTSAFVGVYDSKEGGEIFGPPDRDANFISYGEGGALVFDGLQFDGDFNGRRVDIASLTLFGGEGVPDRGGDVRLGLGSGSIVGASDVFVDAQRDAFVDLIDTTAVTRIGAGRDALVFANALTLANLQTGRDASVTARTGDATVDSASVARDLTVATPNGVAQLGFASVGQDVIVSGREVQVDFIQGYDEGQERARDITLRTTASDLFVGGLAAARNLTLDAVGAVDAVRLDAGGTIRVTATGAARFGSDGEFNRSARGFAGESGLFAGVDFIVDAADILVRLNTPVTAGRDATLTATGRVDIFGFAYIGDDIRINADTIAVGTLTVGFSEAGSGPDSEGDGHNIVLTGTTIDAIRLTAETDVIATASGTIGIGDASCAGNSECDAGAVIAGRDALLSGASFRLDASIEAGRDASLSSVNGNLDLTGENVIADRDLILNAVGSLTIGTASAVRDLRLSATTRAEASSLIAGRDVTVTAADIVLGSARAGASEAGDIVLTGGTIAAARLDASRDVRATATGAAVFGPGACTQCDSTGIVAGQDIVLSAASLALGGTLMAGRDLSLTTIVGEFTSADALTAGQDLIVDAAGALILGSVRAGRDIALTGASASVDDVVAGQDARVTARTGDALVGAATTPRDLSVLAALGLASLGTGNVGGDFLLSGKTVALGSLSAFTPAGYGYGYGTPVPTRDITIAATAGGFAYDGALEAAQDLRITVGGALALTGTTSATRDAVLDGGSVALASATAGRDLSVTARTGTLAATGLLQGGDDVRLTAPTIDVRNIVVAVGPEDSELDGRNIVLAGGSATLTGVTALDLFRATLTGTLATSASTVTAATIEVDAGAIARTSPSSAAAFAATGDATLSTSGSIDTGGVTAGGAAAIDAGGALRLRGAVNGASVVLAGAIVTLDAGINGIASTFVTARSGALTAAAIDSDGDVTVNAAGALTLASARAGDDVVLGAGGALTVTGNLVAGRTGQGTPGADSEGDGRNIRVTGDAVTLAGVDAPTDAVIIGDSVAASSIAVRHNASVTARTGDARVDAATVRGDLSILASTGLARLGNATVGRDLLLRGRSVRLGSLGAYVENAGYGQTLLPTRDIVIDATAGDFVFAGKLAADRDLNASATGLLTLGAVTARDDIRLTGGAVDLVSARALGGNDSEGDGSNVGVVGASLTAPVLSAVTDVRISVGGTANLASGEGGVDARDIIVSAADLTTGRLTATQDLQLTATGSIAGTATQSAARDARVDGGGVTLARLDATRDVILTGGSIDAQIVTTGRDLTATARTGTLSITAATAGDDLRVSGPDVRIASATTTGLGVDTEGDGSDIVVTGGVLSIDSGSAASDLIVTATGTARIGSSPGGVSAGQDIAVSGATLELGNIVAARDLSLTATAGSVTETIGIETEISAGRDLRLDARDAIVAGDLGATRDLFVIASSVTIGDTRAGRDASATARDGSLTIQTATAGDDLRFNGATVAITSATTTGLAADTEGDGSSIAATGGDVRINSADAATDVSVIATGIATVGTGEGGVTATRDILVTGASLALGGLDAGRDLTLNATASGFGAGELRAVRNLTVTAAGALAFDSADAGNDLTLTGTGITGGSATAGRDARLDARTGLLSVAIVSAGDDVRLAGATIDIGEVNATGAGLDDEADGADIGATGGAVTIEIAVTPGDITIAASGVAALGIGSNGETTGRGGDTYLATIGGDIVVGGASVLTGPLAAGGDIRLTASAGAVDARGLLDAGRDLTAKATARIDFAAAASAGRDLSLDGVGIRIDRVSARRDATLAAGSGRLEGLSARAGDDLRLSGASIAILDAGALGSGDDDESDGSNLIVTGGMIELVDAGAAGDVLITASGDLSLTGATRAGRDVALSANGALTTARLDATRDIDATGASVAIGEAAARQDVRVVATKGDAVVTRANVRRDLSVVAVLGLARIGDAAVGRDLILRGASATLGSLTGDTASGYGYGFGYGYGYGSSTRTRDVTITATAGNILGGADLIATRDVRLSASGAAALWSIDAGSIEATTGGALTLGDATAVTALTLDAGGALSGGDFAGDAVTLTGASIDGGTVIAAGDAFATARTGNLTLADVTAGDDARIVAALDIDIGNVRAAAGTAPDSEADGRNVVIAGRATRFVSATADDDVRITATGALIVTGEGIAIVAGRDAVLVAPSLSPGGISAGRDLLLTATASGIAAGDLSAARDLTLDAAGALTFGDVAAARDLSLAGASLGGGNATAGGRIVANARSGDAVLVDLSAGGSLDVTAAGSLQLGNASGSTIGLTGRAIASGSLVAAGDLTATARSGDLTLTNALAGDDIRLTATGSIGGGGLTANGLAADTESDGGNIVVVAGGEIALAALDAPTDVVLTAGELLFADSVAAGRDARLTAASLTPGTMTAGRDIVLTATAGGIDAGDLSSQRDLIADATGALNFGNLIAARDLTLTGGRIDGLSARAGGDVTVTAGLGGLTLSDALAGDDLRLTSAGDVALYEAQTEGSGPDGEGDGSNIVVAGVNVAAVLLVSFTDLTVDAEAGPTPSSLVLGSASARRDIFLSGATIDASADAGRDLFVTGGNITLGGEAGRDIAVTGSALRINPSSRGGFEMSGGPTAGLTAGDDVQIAVTAGVISGFIAATGMGSDSEGDGSNVAVTAASIFLNDVSAANDAIIIATAGDLSVIDVRSSGLGGSFISGGLRAGRDAVATAANGAVLIGLGDAGRDMTIAARDGVGLSETQVGDDLRITGGGAVVLNAAITATGSGTDTEGDGSNLVIAGASVTGRDLNAASDVRVTTTAGLDIDAVTAGRDAVLTAATLAPSGISAGRDLILTATAGGINAGDLSAARDLVANATGALSFGALSATRDLTLTGASVDGGSATAAGDVTATARSGGITLSDTRGGDDVRVTAATDATLGRVTATGAGIDGEGDGFNIAVTGRAVALTAATAPTDVRVVASGALTIAATANAVVAGRDAVLTGATLSPGGVSAGRDLIFTATTGGIAAGDVSAARDLIADAAGALTFGTLAATRDLTLTGASLDGGTARAGGDVNATARSGGIRLGNTQAGDDVRLAAAQDITLGSVAATGLGSDGEPDGSNVVIGGRNVTVVSASAPTDVRVTATGALGVTGAGTGIAAGRDAVLVAASLSPAGVSAGRDVSLTATASGFAGGTLGAVRNLTINATGPLSFGSATAGAALTLTATSIAGTTATAGTDLTATATGVLTLANATAGDDVRLTSATQSLGQVRATGLALDSEGDGSNIVLGGGAVTVGQAIATTDVAITGSGAVSVAQASAGRDVIVAGGSVGGALQLSGRDITVSTGGAFAATSGLVATRDLRLTAGTTLSFAQLTAARDLILTAPVVQGGTATATRDLTVIATTRIAGDRFEAGRNLVLDPDEAIIATVVRAGGDATLIGRSIEVGTLDVGGVTFAQATNGGIALDIFTGRGAATLLATGKISLGASTTPALRIVGGDLDVRRSLVASSLQVETPGRMILGGAEGDAGFVLAAADIARLRVAGQTSFYAAVTTSTAAGGDLVVRDFGYNPADLPRLALFADRTHVVDIQGRVLPSTSGGFIQIGDVNALGRFRPDSIFVSGGFGFAELDVNCFGKIIAVDSLAFYAVNDVIFGLADFRAAIRGAAAETIDLVAGNPAVPAGPRDDRLFAVAGRFTVDAAGKIVSQNTASQAGNYVGLFFNGSGATSPIVSLGNARAIDLAGSLVDSAGNLRSGPTVAFAGELGQGGGGNFIFNGCLVGSLSCGAGGSGATPAEALRLEDYTPPRPVDITDAPLSTVLIVDQAPGASDSFTIGTEDGGIVIRRRPSN